MSQLILEDAFLVARTEHVCNGCGRQIEPGEKYRRQRSVGGDGPYTWKACAHCDALFSHMMRTDQDFRDAAYDDYGVDMAEWLFDYPGSTVAELRLTVQFRRRWRNRGGDLYPVPFGVRPGAPEDTPEDQR